MRLLPVAAAGLTLAVVAGGGSITAVGASRQSSFTTRAASLQHRWDLDVAEGVPQSLITPLRQRLSSSGYEAPWWSPTWWFGTGTSLMDDLQRRTDQVWRTALGDARAQAEAAVSDWTLLQQELGRYVPQAAAADAATWPSRIQTATTPLALTHLASQWEHTLGSARRQAEAAQAAAQRAAALDAQVATYGGVTGLLAKAQAALQVAQADNLDPGTLPQLTAQLADEVAAGATQSDTLSSVSDALQALRSLISLNDSVSGQLRPLLLAADQAAAEGTPSASSFQTQYQQASAALAAARDAAQLTSVQQQMTASLSAINAELAANQCGHNVGSGKVITLNLTLQEAVFYQDGCEVQAGPITTGRPALRTPTGTFHIFYKQSPFEMISEWPPSSPFWYPPSWTHWVMEFNAGGYFIHDAPWEPDSELGPGSENTNLASHGCVHLSHALMQWAYSWTPYGTPVIISA